jgi:hypothetical protein
MEESLRDRGVIVSVLPLLMGMSVPLMPMVMGMGMEAEDMEGKMKVFLPVRCPWLRG